MDHEGFRGDGDPYDVRAKTAVRAEKVPDKAILKELKEASTT